MSSTVPLLVKLLVRVVFRTPAALKALVLTPTLAARKGETTPVLKGLPLVLKGLPGIGARAGLAAAAPAPPTLKGEAAAVV
jgi:hypothetical protein